MATRKRAKRSGKRKAAEVTIRDTNVGHGYPSASARAMAERYIIDEWSEGEARWMAIESTVKHGLSRTDSIRLQDRYKEIWEEVSISFVAYCKEHHAERERARIRSLAGVMTKKKPGLKKARAFGEDF